MAFNERIFEREEVTTGNKHPIATGISSVVFALGVIGFALLAIFSSGCSSPPDDKCSEVSTCNVDGGNTDQPDSNTGNCATNGTCPDAATTTVDAPPATSCAAIAWMENPEMFDCDFFDDSGTMFPGDSCNPELLTGSDGCQIKCLPMFWAVPEQLTVNEPTHSFDFRDPPNRPYPLYSCHQRL